jgi:hypothetical protein
MAARIIKVVGLAVLAAALTASFASAKPYVADETQPVSTPVASAYLNTPALDQGMTAASTPNDKSGTLGIGQNSTDFGMGGQYGQNLIQQRAQDIQKAKTFTLPAPPDERAGTSAAAVPPIVIPYLSEGIGVNQAQFSGTPVRPDDRAGARPSEPTSVPTGVSTPVATTGDGFNWGIAGYGAAGLAAIALAIGLLVVLGRRSRHEGVAVS